MKQIIQQILTPKSVIKQYPTYLLYAIITIGSLTSFTFTTPEQESPIADLPQTTISPQTT